MPRSSQLIHLSCSAVLALGLAGVANAQDRRDRDEVRLTRLEPGMSITIRTSESINTSQPDYRVYTGFVDQDVRGDNGRLAIPRGSTVELILRRSRNDDLLLDLESVAVNGERYAVRTDPNRIVGTSGVDSLVGSIVGAISGGHIRGRDVRVPRGTELTFRLERPLEMGVADYGVTRDGHHFHDYYGRGRQ
jgi:hypothetical protein